jgi:hypothetical protein
LAYAEGKFNESKMGERMAFNRDWFPFWIFR